jgi:hypothetical protein
MAAYAGAAEAANFIQRARLQYSFSAPVDVRSRPAPHHGMKEARR